MSDTSFNCTNGMEHLLCVTCYVLGARDAKINKLWIHPAGKTDL